VAGELGHVIVEAGGRPCYCGNRGCLEMYSASPAIVRSLRASMKAGAQTILARIAPPEALNFSMCWRPCGATTT
jgi:predicted NBD/HSP70 family sugar kinase